MDETRGHFTRPDRRPTGLTLIGWWLVVAGVMAVLCALLTLNMRSHAIAQQEGFLQLLATVLWSAIGGGLMVAIGQAILRGKDWGRVAYTFLGAIAIMSGIVRALAQSPPVGLFGLVVSAQIFIMIVLYLNEPEVKRYLHSA
jgi:peptidoglycan/LPS O-acetylase OafA/YrhL